MGLFDIVLLSCGGVGIEGEQTIPLHPIAGGVGPGLLRGWLPWALQCIRHQLLYLRILGGLQRVSQPWLDLWIDIEQGEQSLQGGLAYMRVRIVEDLH